MGASWGAGAEGPPIPYQPCQVRSCYSCPFPELTLGKQAISRVCGSFLMTGTLEGWVVKTKQANTVKKHSASYNAAIGVVSMESNEAFPEASTVGQGEIVEEAELNLTPSNSKFPGHRTLLGEKEDLAG